MIAEACRTFWRQLWAHEAFSRGMRAFLALASLTFAGWWFGQMQAAITLLLGVIAGGLAETDDSWHGQIRAQFVTLFCFALMAALVQISLPYPVFFAVVLGLAAFGLTMLNALGERYRALSIATLILAIYTALASQASPHVVGPLTDAGRPWLQWHVPLLLIGAAWYGVISVLWSVALPMLPVRQNLARLYAVLGTYLHLKSRLLEPVRGIDLERRRLALALHNGKVVEALNNTKESLFSRTGPDGAAPAWLGEALHLYFVAQDLHERVTSSHEQYDVLANAFFHSDVLYRCQRVMALLGQDCAALSQATAEQGGTARDGSTERALEDLERAIRHIEVLPLNDTDAPHALRPLRSVRALATNLAGMDRVLDSVTNHPHAQQPGRLPADASLLDRNPRTLVDAAQRVRRQMKFSSPLMRHALRMAVALMIGYAVMLYTSDSHGYWIVLTIIFVCRADYGATLTRLAQRVWGTLLGLVVGWALLRLFPNLLVQLAFTVAAGALFFTTRQARYTIATAAITSLVLLSFNQVGDGFGLILPRLLDTVTGGVIAGLAVWLVLPSWQSRRLHSVAAQATRTQARYLREIMAQYQGGKQDHLAYRLARRNAHNADAALSSAMSAVFTEPVYVRRHALTGTRFLVLSHTLLSYLSALGAHRNVQLLLAEDSIAARAAACLLDTLDATALALEAGSGVRVEASADEMAVLEASTHPADEAVDRMEADAQRVMQALLILAMQLLPQLREQAADFADRPGGKRLPGKAAAATPPSSLPLP